MGRSDQSRLSRFGSSRNTVTTLACLDVHHSFAGNPNPVLTGVNLALPANTTVALTGESGSGKTTLLNLLGLLDQPSQGSVHIMGEDTSRLKAHQLRKLRAHAIGFVFQDSALDHRRTAAENVALTLRYSGTPREKRHRAAVAALEKTNLSHMSDTITGTMSGGERQRVAIARAIAHTPPILLCDEPTGALDGTNTNTIVALLQSIAAEGSTVVVVTHDLDVAAQCNQHIKIARGTLT